MNNKWPSRRGTVTGNGHFRIVSNSAEMLLRAFQLCSRRSRSVVAEESLINQMTDDSVDGIDKFQESFVSLPLFYRSRETVLNSSPG